MTGEWERGTKRAIHLGRLPYRNQTKSQHQLLLHPHNSQPFVKGRGGQGEVLSRKNLPQTWERAKSPPLPREQENPQALNHSCSTQMFQNSRNQPLHFLLDKWYYKHIPLQSLSYTPLVFSTHCLSDIRRAHREIKLHEGLFKRILFEWFLQRLLQYESLCLIEISSCLVKHTEVTQKYISELTELKKSKDYMQPEQNTFLYFLPIFRLGWNLSTVPHCIHRNLSGNAEIVLFGNLDTPHTVFTKKLLQIH